MIGHATFISLGKREALSVFAEVYTFIRRHYKQEVELWRSVKKELNIWDGISPLITQDLSAPWCEKLQAVDASEWGLGVCETEAELVEVEQLSRFSERWRFRDPEVSRARNLVIEENNEEDRSFALVEEEEVDEIQFQPKSFVGVGFGIVSRPWDLVGRCKWKKRESMPVLEARSSLFAVKHALRRISSQRKRHIILTDSMTAALAFTKGRAKGQKLRNIVQKVASLSLATGSTFFPRWIPSEWNPADGPSRGRHAPSVPQKLLVDAVPRLEDPEAGITFEEKGFGSFTGADRPETQGEKEKSKINTEVRSRDHKTKIRGEPTTSLFGGAGDSGSISGALEELPDLGSPEKDEAEDRGDGGSGFSELLGPPMDGGRRLVRSKLCKGERSFPSPRPEGKRISQQGLPGLERMEEAGATTKQNAVAVRSCDTAGFGCCPPRKSRNRLGPSSELCPLPQTWEFETLRVGDIIRPVKKGGPIYQFWSILLHPQEEGVPSKTQQWDEALTLDLAYHSYLGPAMDRHLRLKSRSKSSKAFTVEMKEVNDFMLDRWKHHNLQVLKKPHLYRLRHGGASHELGGKLRTIQEVQIRGRWLCTKSLKNYEKAGRMAQLLGSLDEAKQQECVQAREEIGKALLGRR